MKDLIIEFFTSRKFLSNYLCWPYFAQFNFSPWSVISAIWKWKESKIKLIVKWTDFRSINENRLGTYRRVPHIWNEYWNEQRQHAPNNIKEYRHFDMEPTEHLLDLFTSESEHPKLIIIIVLSNINKRILSPESTSRTGAWEAFRILIHAPNNIKEYRHFDTDAYRALTRPFYFREWTSQVKSRKK